MIRLETRREDTALLGRPDHHDFISSSVFLNPPGVLPGNQVIGEGTRVDLPSVKVPNPPLVLCLSRIPGSQGSRGHTRPLHSPALAGGSGVHTEL